MATSLRPLSLGELLDRTVSLFRRNFVLFSAIMALPALPTLALNLWRIVVMHPTRASTPQEILTASFYSLLISLVLLVPAIIGSALSTAATVVAVSRIHLDQPVTIADAFRAIRHRILGIVGIIIVVGVLTGLGFIVLIVPGILLLLRWALVIPAAVLESKGLWQAMDRSAALTSGDYGRIFAIYALYFVVLLAAGGLVDGIVATGVYASGGAFGQPGATPLWSEIVLVVGSYFVSSFVGPLMTIAVSLVYYDERVRKEAFDVQHLLMQLDSSTPSPAPAV